MLEENKVSLNIMVKPTYKEKLRELAYNKRTSTSLLIEYAIEKTYKLNK